MDCDFGDLQFADVRTTFMRLRATQAGSFNLAAEVMSLDDSDVSDNSASVTVNVDAAVAAQPAPPPSAGGGGGGSLDWATLLLGALGVGLRCRRRPSAPWTRARSYTRVDAPMDLRIDDRGAGDVLASRCADEYTAVRTRFRVAYAAAQAGGTGSTTPDDDELRAYPLYPYLQVARFERDLGADAAITEFLAEHGAAAV